MKAKQGSEGSERRIQRLEVQARNRSSIKILLIVHKKHLETRELEDSTRDCHQT